jgi:uracil-DNA glycosylase
MAADFLRDRGNPWDHDPGPEPTSRIARLFAETPNYRALGRALVGREAFRWHFGPMFYRGRLADQAVKVLVIGQEGAQDESIGHRSFVGGTGARMQHFLHALGITESYLFLNTFVYPIFGQYQGRELLALAQRPESPIVRHRHAILDDVRERNDLRLIIAVGRAAKESVHTWVTAHGGRCPAGAHDVSACDAAAIGPRTRIIGVVHPGGAGQGGSVAAIIADFKRALAQVSAFAAADPTWLPLDPGGERPPADTYKYRSAPIPFRDFPYGSSWRVGQGGTSSNRKDNQRGIQLFSEDGDYAATVPYASTAAGTREGYEEAAGDLPYEPPKRDFAEVDRGPDPAMARLMMGGEPGLAWPDFAALGVTSHVSFGHGPIYRGRLRDPRLLVIADQESHDDLFTGRALSGDGGQHLQAWLQAAGYTTRYTVLRVLPVDTLDLAPTQVEAIVDHPQVRAVQRAIVAALTASGSVGAAVLVGPLAQRLAPHVLPAGLKTFAMPAWREEGARESWRAALQALRTAGLPADIASPSFEWDGRRGQIPRRDLPFGTLRWQGSSGDRALRGVVAGRPSPHYYKVLMPTWAFQLAPTELSTAEREAVDRLRP